MIKFLKDLEDQHNSELSYTKKGLFLSSIINNTALQILKVKNSLYGIDHIGYKLKPKKIIVMYEAPRNTGSFNEGIIINFSEIQNLREKSKQGLILNFRGANNLVEEAEGGICVNYGNSHTIGSGSKKIIAINQGMVENLASNSKNAIAINQYKAGFFANKNEENININLGEIPQLPLYRGIDLNFYNFVKQELNPQIIKLEKKIAELDFVKGLNSRYGYKKELQDSDDQILKRLSEFNTAQFQKDLTAICEEIKERYEKLVGYKAAPIS